MFILSSKSSGLEFWPVNRISLDGNSELNAFLKIKVLGEISSNWRINVYKTLESCWWSLLPILQWTNTTSVISKWG